VADSLAKVPSACAPRAQPAFDLTVRSLLTVWGPCLCAPPRSGRSFSCTSSCIYSWYV